jgi:hypothetical protein
MFFRLFSGAMAQAGILPAIYRYSVRARSALAYFVALPEREATCH